MSREHDRCSGDGEGACDATTPRIALLCVMTMASACRCGGGPGDDLADLVVDAWHDKREACWRDSIRGAVDDYEPSLQIAQEGAIRLWLVGPVRHGHASLSSAGVDACVDAITRGTCKVIEEDPLAPCRRLPLWNGTLLPGADCELHGECTTGYCKHGYTPGEGDVEECGRCAQQPSGVGASCVDLPCSGDLVCELDERELPVCVESEHAACGWGKPDCIAGEMCNAARCIPVPGRGAPCAVDPPVCGTGLNCEDNACVDGLARGAPCDDGRTNGGCAQEDACVNGVCARRPIAGEACSDTLVCRADAQCSTKFFAIGEIAPGLPPVCVPNGILGSNAQLLAGLRGMSFCDGCDAIEVVDEGACDVFAGPRVCSRSMSTRYCAAAPGAREGACADRPGAGADDGDACQPFMAPCAYPDAICTDDAVCVAPAELGESCAERPCIGFIGCASDQRCLTEDMFPEAGEICR